jgi:hypothetical protein
MRLVRVALQAVVLSRTVTGAPPRGRGALLAADFGLEVSR